MLEILPATVSQINDIRRLARDGELFDYGFVYNILISKKWLFIAKNGLEVVGYVAIIPCKMFNVGFCLQVSISNQHRKTGYGKILLDLAHSTLRNTFNIKKVYAHTLKPETQNYFTSRFGYQPVIELFGITLISRNLQDFSLHEEP